MKKTTIILVWALLCLKKRKGERPKLKAYLLITLLLCLFNGQIIAQITKPLKMGDRLPEIFWQHRHNVYQNGNALTQNLAANKGKFIILDFWATWCGTCVSKFPLVDSLQKENPELKIILVNSTTVKEKPMALQTFFTKNLIGSKYQMPTIVGDTLLTKMFPFKVLPHLVWIDGTGMVIAMSTYHFFDRKTIADRLIEHQRTLKKQKQ